MSVSAVSGLVRLLAFGLAVALAPAGPMAQTLDQIEAPAEQPPSDFEGGTYVDSLGCVFLRAGVGGEVNWVPRVNAQRKPICGETPTLGGSAPVEAQTGPATDLATAPATTAAPEVPAGTSETPPKMPAVAATTEATDMAAPTVRKPQTQPRSQRVPRVPKRVHVAATPPRCHADAPMPARIKTLGGETVVVCTRGDGTLDGARMPVGSTRLLVVRPATGAAQDGRARLWTRDVAARLVYPSGTTARRVVAQSLDVAPTTGARTVVVQTRRDTAATGHRYVQIGTFGILANAEAARQHLRARGLPVGTAQTMSAGHPLQIVLAGPFATAEAAREALLSLRSAGYRDAFLR